MAKRIVVEDQVNLDKEDVELYLRGKKFVPKTHVSFAAMQRVLNYQPAEGKTELENQLDTALFYLQVSLEPESYALILQVLEEEDIHMSEFGKFVELAMGVAFGTDEEDDTGPLAKETSSLSIPSADPNQPFRDSGDGSSPVPGSTLQTVGGT